MRALNQISRSGIGSVQNNPDGGMPGCQSKTWAPFVKSPTAHLGVEPVRLAVAAVGAALHLRTGDNTLEIGDRRHLQTHRGCESMDEGILRNEAGQIGVETARDRPGRPDSSAVNARRRRAHYRCCRSRRVPTRTTAGRNPPQRRRMPLRAAADPSETATNEHASTRPQTHRVPPLTNIPTTSAMRPPPRHRSTT